MSTGRPAWNQRHEAVAGGGYGRAGTRVRLSPRTTKQIDSPTGTAYALVAGRRRQSELLDLPQAAPLHPPALCGDIAEFARRLTAFGG
jgi:hypothetical protein